MIATDGDWLPSVFETPSSFPMPRERTEGEFILMGEAGACSRVRTLVRSALLHHAVPTGKNA